MPIFAAAVIATLITLVLTLRTNWRIARWLPAGETVDVDVRACWLRMVRRSDFGWALIAKVIETADHVFLCVTPLTALIVPLGAFATLDEKTAFADLSESLSRGADV